MFLHEKIILWRNGFRAFPVSLIQYSVQTDEETGMVGIRSLLRAWRKTPPKEGEEKGSYAFAVPPSGPDDEEAEDWQHGSLDTHHHTDLV